MLANTNNPRSVCLSVGTSLEAGNFVQSAGYVGARKVLLKRLNQDLRDERIGRIVGSDVEKADKSAERQNWGLDRRNYVRKKVCTGVAQNPAVCFSIRKPVGLENRVDGGEIK